MTPLRDTVVAPAMRSRRSVRLPDSWTLGALLLVGLIAAPLVPIVVGAFAGSDAAWEHLLKHRLAHYVAQTLGLVAGTVGLALLFGIPSAWLIAAFDFPGRRVLEPLLIMPLAVPGYVAAYAWSGLFDWAGPIQTLLRGAGIRLAPGLLDIRSLAGLIVVLASVLFPYVYLTCRASFARQSRTVIEAANSLGLTQGRAFFAVALPMVWPAAAAGGFLIAMETINDYGAVHYFGVDTLTIGVFRTWFSLEAEDAALRLAAILLLAAALLVIGERVVRGRRSFADVSGRHRPLARTRLTGRRGWAATLVCCIPVLLGFVVPVGMQVFWAAGNLAAFADPGFLGDISRSFSLAAAATVICIAAAWALLASARLAPGGGQFGSWLARVGQLGYAVPGAVLGLGVLVVVGSADRRLIALIRDGLGLSNPGLVLGGSAIGLLFAYLVRFLAVASQPLDGSYARLHRHLDEVARSLGSGRASVVWRVHLPLLRGGLLAAATLVFIDVMKELPLTLILRPFDFETLATRAYRLASDERVPQTAVPALVMIAVSIPAVLAIDGLTRKRT